MNVIPFVMAILLILTYGMAASMQGRFLTHRNQKAYLSLRGAELDILRKSERRQFKAMPGTPVKKEQPPRSSRPKQQAKSKKSKQTIELNAPCARLNLYPLILEGRDANAALYETAAKTLRIFYQTTFFHTEKRFEYKLLDAILAGAKAKIEGKNSLALETIAIQDPSLQPLYYALLKGTKHYQLSEVGYPTLVDYWKIEKETGKICLFHCHPDMLTIFFGPKTAPKLFKELRENSKKAGMSLDAILEWASDPQLRFVEKAVWDLIDFKRPQHSDSLRQTMIGQEGDVLIRKNIALKSASSPKKS